MGRRAVTVGAWSRRLREDLDLLVERTGQLVAIDSGTEDVAGVEAVCAAAFDGLEAAGFEVARHPVADRAACWEATLELGDGPAVVVVGHADTVWPAGTAAAWPMTRDGDWITGPGVGDMKAALVMAAHVLGLVAGEDGLPWGRVSFLVTGDEIQGSVASRPVIEQVATRADVCLTLEGVQSGGGMVVARGAVGAVQLVAHGRSAHCTEPGGASVITELAPLLPRIEALSDADEGSLVSIGTLRAGTARQVVPDHAVLDIDVRGRTQAVAERAVERLQALVAEERRDPGVRLELRGGVTRPAFGRERSDALFAAAVAAAAELGLPARGIEERGGSDASFFGAAGVLTLDGLGPYCEESCSRRERVSVTSIAERGAVLAHLLQAPPVHALPGSGD